MLMRRRRFTSFCQVIEASNGQEALHMLDEVRPNLILSDVMMPSNFYWKWIWSTHTEIANSSRWLRVNLTCQATSGNKFVPRCIFPLHLLNSYKSGLTPIILVTAKESEEARVEGLVSDTIIPITTIPLIKCSIAIGCWWVSIIYFVPNIYIF